MLKSDLIDLLMQKRGISLVQATSAIDTIFESMKDALCKGENIEIRGLGSFHVKHHDGYQGHNPNTGQVIQVKPKRGVFWRTGKYLGERLNPPVRSPEVMAAVEQATPAPNPAGTGEPNKEPGSGTANQK